MKLSIRKYFSKILTRNLTFMKILAKTTRGPVHLQLFRPSVIRGPCLEYLPALKIYKKEFCKVLASLRTQKIFEASRKLDEIHISYKVEKPVLVAMLTH